MTTDRSVAWRCLLVGLLAGCYSAPSGLGPDGADPRDGADDAMAGMDGGPPDVRVWPDAPPCPPLWVQGPFGSCYYADATAASRGTAVTACATMGAHLVVIESQDEDDWLIQNLDAGPDPWMGLERATETSPWRWADGTTLGPGAWTNWEPGEPNSVDLCAELNGPSSSYPGTWEGTLCTDLDPHGFICELP